MCFVSVPHNLLLYSASDHHCYYATIARRPEKSAWHGEMETIESGTEIAPLIRLAALVAAARPSRGAAQTHRASTPAPVGESDPNHVIGVKQPLGTRRVEGEGRREEGATKERGRVSSSCGLPTNINSVL